MDELLHDFLIETNESLETVDVQLVRFEQQPDNQDILRAIFRLVHTIKGTCGFLDLPRLEALAHAAESAMGRFRDGQPVTRRAVSLILASIDRIRFILAEIERTAAEPEGSDQDLVTALELETDARPEAPAATFEEINEQDTPEAPSADATLEENLAPEIDEAGEVFASPAAVASTLRVSVNTIERLLTMVSELVLTRNQLLEIARQQGDHGFNVPLQRLSHVTAELQECVMRTRMQPIGNAWHKLPRMVRDLNRELGKDIALVLQGADTELDRQVLDHIKDPLAHMVRNAADHGLESREQRIAAGKSARGTITLSAFHSGGSISIEISDDGRGLDLGRIRTKALERGLASEAELERMSDAQLMKFIFVPGFSTARELTPISGRGVGLDVVHTNIDAIGGTIDVRSSAGHGTTFVISLPLTLAIVPALLVGVGDYRFALPQGAVTELVRAGAEARIEKLNGGTVVVLRGQMLPLVSLADLLQIEGPAEAGRSEGDFVVVMTLGTRRFAVTVDAVFHTEEIVVKPMSAKLRHIHLFSGNTILGDGTVVLILDPNGLARSMGAASETERHGVAVPTADEGSVEETGEQTSLLVLKAGQGESYAVPISAITRLEEIETDHLEQAGSRLVIQYRGRLMPLVSLSGAHDFKTGKRKPCLVLSHGDKSMGLLVDEIVDVVEEHLDLDLGGARAGCLGSMIVQDRATDILDAGYYLAQTFPEIGQRRAFEAEGTAGLRVLLVEGSAFFRDMFIPTLRAAGYAVSSVGTAEAAMAQASSGMRFSAAVVGRHLPDQDGLDCMAALMRREGTRDAAMLVLSPDFDPADCQKALDLGARAVLSGFDRQGLIEALDRFAGKMEQAA